MMSIPPVIFPLNTYYPPAESLHRSPRLYVTWLPTAQSPLYFQGETPTPTPSTPGHLKAYVVSDVHLNNHPYNRQAFTENPRRQHFREFLSDINRSLQKNPTQRIELILNGDIFDLTGSWKESVFPWDADKSKAEKSVHKVISQILDNNQRIAKEFQQFLSHPNTSLRYVIGNHDNMFNLFPSAQERLRDFLAPTPERRGRLQFMDEAITPELGLYATHGHQLDRFNRSSTKHPFPTGDYVNILIVNRFVENIVDKLKKENYSPEVIESLHQKLHEIEYLRPLVLVPLWIQSVANQYKHHPESKGKRLPIDKIILSVMPGVLEMFLSQNLPSHRYFPKKTVASISHWMMNQPWGLKLVSPLISRASKHGHSNEKQIALAQKLHQTKGYRYIAMGHTHQPETAPLSQDAFFFNSGSWKPVITLFKPDFKKRALSDTLKGDAMFNKVEHSGVLMVETIDPAEGKAGGTTTRFSLKTLQGS